MKKLLLPLTYVLFSIGVATAQTIPEKPNVIVILTDDHGYADAGFQNLTDSEDVYTPNLDAFASNGLIMENGYASYAVCGPSRAGLMTGRTPSRFGMQNNDIYIPKEEIFIPRAIKSQCYASALFGKWHLGRTPGTYPVDRGFDYYWGDIPKLKDYFMYNTQDPPCWQSGRKSPGENGRYITDAYTDEATTFIEDNKDKPFFAFVSYNAPHSPFLTTRRLLERLVAARPQWQATYDKMLLETDKWSNDGERYAFGPWGQGVNVDFDVLRLTYLSMLLAADDGVGKIIQTLEDNNLTEKTLIFFMSDNGGGPDLSLGGVNLPLRSGKNFVYDGGIRVPFVVSWPGVIQPGRDTETIVSALDVFATTVELSGATIPNDRIIDGVNIIPYLTGQIQGQPHDALFWRRDTQEAVRSGDYKYRMTDWSTELFNVENEIEEETNLLNSEPLIAANMQALYDEFNATLPDTVDPDNDDDGVKDIDDICVNTPPGVAVDSNGCSVAQTADADGDGVYDINDECLNTEPGAVVYWTGCVVEAGEDALLSVSGPAVVTQGETITVEIEYYASQTRDIIVNLQENNNDLNNDSNLFTNIASERNTVTTVCAGETATISVEMTVDANATLADNEYRYTAFITEIGGFFNNPNTVSGTPQTGVTVVDNGLGTSNYELENHIKVYPNPAENNLKIVFDKGYFGLTASIMDLSGRVLMTKKLVAPESTLDVSNLSNGIYMLCTKKADKTQSINKIIVQH